MRRFVTMLLLSISIVVIILLLCDMVRFPECYIIPWKVQLKNDIHKGNKQAIELYESVYVSNNRDLFGDDFGIRNVYMEVFVCDE